MHTKVLFHCSNTNTNSPLSSNRLTLEKQQLRNLKFAQHCACFAGWQVLKTYNSKMCWLRRDAKLFSAKLCGNGGTCYYHALCKCCRKFHSITGNVRRKKISLRICRRVSRLFVRNYDSGWTNEKSSHYLALSLSGTWCGKIPSLLTMSLIRASQM